MLLTILLWPLLTDATFCRRVRRSNFRPYANVKHKISRCEAYACERELNFLLSPDRSSCYKCYGPSAHATNDQCTCSQPFHLNRQTRRCGCPIGYMIEKDENGSPMCCNGIKCLCSRGESNYPNDDCFCPAGYHHVPHTATCCKNGFNNVNGKCIFCDGLGSVMINGRCVCNKNNSIYGSRILSSDLKSCECAPDHHQVGQKCLKNCVGDGAYSSHGRCMCSLEGTVLFNSECICRSGWTASNGKCVQCQGPGAVVIGSQCSCGHHDEIYGKRIYKNGYCQCSPNYKRTHNDICIKCYGLGASLVDGSCSCDRDNDVFGERVNINGYCACAADFQRSREGKCIKCHGIGPVVTGGACKCDQNNEIYGDRIMVDGECKCGDSAVTMPSGKCVRCGGLGAMLVDDMCSCDFNDATYGPRYEEDGVCKCRKKYFLSSGNKCIRCHGPGAVLVEGQCSCSVQNEIYGERIEIDGYCRCQHDYVLGEDGRCVRCLGPGAFMRNGICDCTEDNEDFGQRYNDNGQCKCKDNYILSSKGKCVKCQGPGAILENDKCVCNKADGFDMGKPGQCQCRKNFLLNFEHKCIECYGPGASLINGQCSCNLARELYGERIYKNGQCVCHDNYVLSPGGKCIKCYGPGAVLVGETCQCGTSDGIILAGKDYPKNGECTCPNNALMGTDGTCIVCHGPGAVLISNACSCIENNAVYGQRFLQHGMCSCGADYHLSDSGKCIKCKGLGAKLSGGQCSCDLGNDEFGKRHEENGECFCDVDHLMNSDGKCIKCSGVGAFAMDNKCYCGLNNREFGERYEKDGVCVCKNNFVQASDNQCVKCHGDGSYIKNKLCACSEDMHLVNGECLHKCIDGLYKPKREQCGCGKKHIRDELTGECRKCPVRSIIVANQCVCPPNSQLKGNSCVRCPSKSYLDDNNQCTCQQKYKETESGKCVKCFGTGAKVDEGRCSCEPGSSLFHGECVSSDKLMRSCRNETYYNATSQMCANCTDNGQYHYKESGCECQGPGNFVTDEGYCGCRGEKFSTYLAGDRRTCVYCQENSKLNVKKSVCETCSGPGLLWDRESGCSCDTINSGTILEKNGRICSKCPSGTILDQANSRCVSCKGHGAHLVQLDEDFICSCDVDSGANTILINDTCTVCPAGTMAAKNITKAGIVYDCIQCDGPTSVIASSGECKCDYPYIIRDGKCVSCQLDSIWHKRTCIACSGKGAVIDNNGQCSCKEGYVQNGTTCTECSEDTKYDLITKTCIKCSGMGSHIYGNGTCGCFWGFLNGTVCQPCDEKQLQYKTSCIDCSGPTSHLQGQVCSCAEGHVLVDDNLCVSCSSDIHGSKCNLCDEKQIQYKTTCVDCSGPTSHLQDQVCSCGEGHVLVDDKQCVSCSSDMHGSKCNLCDEKQLQYKTTCVDCSGPTSHLQDQVCSCGEGHIMFNDKLCVSCSSGMDGSHELDADGICTCKKGYQLNTDGNKCIRCEGHGAYIDNDVCRCSHDKTNPQHNGGSCNCPSGHGWTGDNCIDCVVQGYDYYNSSTLTCHCGIGSSFDVHVQKCFIPCPEGHFSDFIPPNRLCVSCFGPGAIYTDHKCHCEADNTYLNGTECCCEKDYELGKDNICLAINPEFLRNRVSTPLPSTGPTICEEGLSFDDASGECVEDEVAYSMIALLFVLLFLVPLLCLQCLCIYCKRRKGRKNYPVIIESFDPPNDKKPLLEVIEPIADPQVEPPQPPQQNLPPTQSEMELPEPPSPPPENRFDEELIVPSQRQYREKPQKPIRGSHKDVGPNFISTQTDVPAEKIYSHIPTQTSYEDMNFSSGSSWTSATPKTSPVTEDTATEVPVLMEAADDTEISTPIITNHQVSQTDCFIEWEKQENVTYYMISSLKIGSDISKAVVQKLDGEFTKTYLTGLEASCSYQILLTAFNAKNKYKKSKYLIVKTLGIPPGKPQRLIFQVCSSDSLQINWGEPEHLNGILSGYIVEYYPSDNIEKTSKLPIPDPKQRSILVSLLQEGTEYTYNILAVNEWGVSESRSATYQIDVISSESPRSSIHLGRHSNYQSLVDVSSIDTQQSCDTHTDVNLELEVSKLEAELVSLASIERTLKQRMLTTTDLQSVQIELTQVQHRRAEVIEMTETFKQRILFRKAIDEAEKERRIPIKVYKTSENESTQSSNLRHQVHFTQTVTEVSETETTRHYQDTNMYTNMPPQAEPQQFLDSSMYSNNYLDASDASSPHDMRKMSSGSTKQEFLIKQYESMGVNQAGSFQTVQEELLSRFGPPLTNAGSLLDNSGATYESNIFNQSGGGMSSSQTNEQSSERMENRNRFQKLQDDLRYSTAETKIKSSEKGVNLANDFDDSSEAYVSSYQSEAEFEPEMCMEAQNSDDIRLFDGTLLGDGAQSHTSLATQLETQSSVTHLPFTSAENLQRIAQRSMMGFPRTGSQSSNNIATEEELREFKSHDVETRIFRKSTTEIYDQVSQQISGQPTCYDNLKNVEFIVNQAVNSATIRTANSMSEEEK